MISRILAGITVISCCTLAVLLFATNPTSIGPGGMLAVFILGYLSLLGVVTFLLFLGAKATRAIVHVMTGRLVRTTLTLRRAYLYSSVLAVIPMLFVSLYSAGGIMWYEVLLLILFGAIGVVYIAKRT